MIDKRLQQARQMYAMGQRVAKTLDGSRPGYRGSDYGDQTRGTGAYSGSGGDSSPAAGGTQGGGTTGGGSTDDRSSDTQQYNHYEAISRNTGVDNNPLRPSGIGPGFIKPGDIDGLTLSPYEQQRVDFLDTPYKQFNIPPFVPGGMVLNTVGNFIGGTGAKKNRQFFADNVAGKYGFGYGMDAYKDYMRQRSAGEVGAYGNENMGQNAIDARARDGGGGGIMDVYTNNTTDDTTDDTTTQDELILRFLGKNSTLDPAAAGLANTDELRAMILERAKNLYK